MPKVVALKKDWLKLGYVLFSQEGIKGIVVERMAAKLKCNKSSFYWHFESKEKFMEKLVDYWVQTETVQIMASVDEENTPKKKYEKFLHLVLQPDPYVDFIFFLKRYARKNKRIRDTIDAVDARRMEFTSTIFREVGCDPDEATAKASAFYKYLLGFHVMAGNPNEEKGLSKEIQRELEGLLCFSSQQRRDRAVPTK